MYITNHVRREGHETKTRHQNVACKHKEQTLGWLQADGSVATRMMVLPLIDVIVELVLMAAIVIVEIIAVAL